MARRVLVVDDEPEIRSVLRAYLEHGGFVVAEAGTGAEALRRALAADGTAPDVVLLDIGLPDLDGLEVLRTIRRTSDVYVVLVTARADEVDTLVGLGYGRGRLRDEAVLPQGGCGPGGDGAAPVGIARDGHSGRRPRA